MMIGSGAMHDGTMDVSTCSPWASSVMVWYNGL